MSKKKHRELRRRLKSLLRHQSHGYWIGSIQRRDDAKPGNLYKLVFALIILILIVLQFGRKPQQKYNTKVPEHCEGCDQIEACFPGNDNYQNNQLIDNSILFIIVFFMLIVCSGCLPGGIQS